MELFVGGKRPGAEGDGFQLREVKRVKKDVKKVAEMVLVLAGIGRMRGGKLPSQLERELIVDARDKLVGLCQDFAPKDVFHRDVLGSVIDDLGLGMCKEQRLGFRPPKMSISDKLLLSKKKFQMEKSEDFALPPPSAPQRLQGATATAFENCGTSVPVRVTTKDTPSQVHDHFSRQQPTALGPVAEANSTPPPLPYQLPTSEVRASVSNFVISSHPLKDSSSLPSAKVDRPPFKVDGRPNGSSHSHVSQAQSHAQSTWNQTMVKTPGWHVQSQSSSSAQRGSDNRVSMHATQVEGVVADKSGMTTQPATCRPLATQVTAGNPPTLQQSTQSNNCVQKPHTRISHIDIANIVQNVLQQNRERPLWTPPSRDYMNKALACQTCQSTVTDVDSILICDNCEKGYHLKCLQTAYHKGAIKGEWHCLRCLATNHGKPLPPKYGRIMRNQKSVGPSPDKKGETVDVKPNLQTANGNILMQKGPPGIARCLSSQQTSDSKLRNVFKMHSSEALSSEEETEDITSGTSPHKISSASHLMPSEKSADEKRLVNLVPKPLSNSNTVLIMDHIGLQRSGKFPSSEEHCGRFSSHGPQKELKGDELGVVQVNHAEASTSTSMSTGPMNSSSGHSSVFDWVGNISEVVDGKNYYQSCRINGVVYRLHDYVLIPFGNDKLTPSKLQAMWEDSTARSKWVTVNRCYFPSDLPKTVGRPCGLESSEVYNSACGSSIEADLIQGPCDVLPPNKFEAEKQRRACSAMEEDYTSRPCFVCKWMYDESKELFRDVSC